MAEHGSLVGQRLSETYVIVRELARGGMGTIYEAVHLRLGGKRYAIKVLASRYVANPDALARFRREALVTSGLRHEHIVEVHDFNTDGELAYLVMELLVGEDLAARLQRASPIPIDAIARILAQVVTALDAAHRARIVHRDLKPQNIFLCTRDGRDDYVKVLDFGVSKLLDSSTALTGEHALLGTPYYMAPEQALGKQDIDGRADVFALGAILWELLTGRLAFAAPTLSGALYRVCQVDPPDVHRVRPDLPPAVSMVIRRALAKEPAERTPDAVTLGREFAAALRGAAPDSVPPPAPGGVVALAEVLGQASPDTVASSPVAPATRPPVPSPAEGRAGARPASGSLDHGAGPSPAAVTPVSAAPLAGAALPASMPGGPTRDRPAPFDPGAAPIANDPVHVPARRSRRRAIIALAAICVTAIGSVTGAVLGVVARSSNEPGAGERTAVAPPPRPTPAPAPQRSDEVVVVFEIEPAGAQVALRVDGVLIPDRQVRRPRSWTPLVVTAEAAGYLPFRDEPVPDQDRIVLVNLRPSPAVAPKGAPVRRAPAPARTTRPETQPRPATAPIAGSPAATPDRAAPAHEPPPPTTKTVRPRYIPSPAVTGQIPPDAGVASSPQREASAPPDAGARPPLKTGTIFDNP